MSADDYAPKLQRLLHGRPGAVERWNLLRDVGCTDDELQKAVLLELGSRPRSNSDVGLCGIRVFPRLQFFDGRYAGQGVPAVEGNACLQLIRQALAIPQRGRQHSERPESTEPADSESQPQGAEAPMAKTTKTKTTKRSRAAKQDRAVQPDLPGTEAGLPKMSKKLRNLRQPITQAIVDSGNAKLRENELKEEARKLMEAEHVTVLPLMNGGTLVLVEGESSIVYHKPPKKATVTEAISGGDEAEGAEQ